MAFWNDINSYRLHDPYSNFKLEEIPDDLSRIKSLIVRRKSNEIVVNHFYTLIGAFEILLGMRYHYQNVLKIKAELGIEKIADDRVVRNIEHESVAYINRAGQFFYFATSQLIQNKIAELEDIAPTLCTARIFRNKHAAHRSIDQPRKDDTIYMQEQHAIAMNKYGGRLWSPKTGCKPNKNKLMLDYSKHYFMCQIQLDDGKTVLQFSVERDHPKITAEAYSIYEAAFR